MNEQVVESIGDFKYPGSILSRGGCLSSGVEQRLRQGRRISETLKAISRNWNVNTEVKMTLPESVLLPAMLYDSETWTPVSGADFEVGGSGDGIPEECM